jgi:hypothetical protein
MQQSPSAETNVSGSQEIPSISFHWKVPDPAHTSQPLVPPILLILMQRATYLSQLTDRSVNYTAKHAANFITYRNQKTCSKLDEPRTTHNSQCVSSSRPPLFLPSRLHYANSHAFLFSRTCHTSQVTTGDQSKLSGFSLYNNTPASCHSYEMSPVLIFSG